MPTTTDDLLLGLDEQQRSAVLSSAPLLAVIAGAGSGKTAVLTRRLAHRALSESIDPRHTVVLTFTRQAADELRRRVSGFGLSDRPIAGTFHSVALMLLRQFWDDRGRRHPTVVSDRSRLVAELLGSDARGRVFDTVADLDWIRARNLSIDRIEKSELTRSLRRPTGELAQVIADYEALKRKRGVLDLDDLLLQSLRLVNDDGQFAAAVQWRLRHFFIDEAQDLNPLQLAVLQAWRGDRDDVTVVGDPAQAIYGFNGSDPSILLELEKHFPGVEVVRLDTNYRCTPEIVAAGLRVLARLDAPVPALHSARSPGRQPLVIEFVDETTEASGVAAFVERMRVEQWRDTAVLARTNAQLPAIRAALEAAGVPSSLSGSASTDPVQRAVREAAERTNRHQLAAWSRDAREPSDESDDDITARRHVADAVDEFLREGGKDGLGFSAWVRINRPFRREDDGVELLTFHAAKGREWSTVILVGAEDGLVPHSSARTPAEVAEEIRLSYVAITRASDRLVVTRAQARRGRPATPSPFLDSFPPDPDREAPSPEFIAGQVARRIEPTPSDPIAARLFEWRDQAARTSRVDPRLICSDATIELIARTKPTNIDELAEIPGVGRPLAHRAGTRILEAITPR
ncbi:MAG: ATP-dependent helicase [Actinomycetota bacterium]